MSHFIIQPNPDAEDLTQIVEGLDHQGLTVTQKVVLEKPLTIFLDGQKIVTTMTVGDMPDLLALGYLANQQFIDNTKEVLGIDYDDETATIVVRTTQQSNMQKAIADKMENAIRTSGCAQGTMFGEVVEQIAQMKLENDGVFKTSWLNTLTKKINTTDSLYLAAGAIHGAVLAQQDKALIYIEDVGRHNAIDKIAGWMFKNKISAKNKILYTTGRLTSEMVLKAVMMRIPVVVSRSGFTAWGVELARKCNLTLIGRARGHRFIALSGWDRIQFDSFEEIEDSPKTQRKSSRNIV